MHLFHSNLFQQEAREASYRGTPNMFLLLLLALREATSSRSAEDNATEGQAHGLLVEMTPEGEAVAAATKNENFFLLR